MEVPVADDPGIDKEERAKELLYYFRKDAVAIIDVKNSRTRPNTNYVDLEFIGIKFINR